MTALADSKDTQAEGFDLFRLSKSKEVVDVCPNTLRGYFKEGLSYYQRGKAVFVSKTELRNFITAPVRRKKAGVR
jgi:hypothetical protein